ncbi:MAG: hypothetical protein MI746_18395 [Pseudomonadales bacterium]|nr:hypothetical protein [Pseudomonadales bacterium]
MHKLLVLIAFSLPVSAMAQDDFCQSIEVIDNSVSIPVSIGGNDYRALLNTTNIAATMSNALAEELDLEVKTHPRRRLRSDVEGSLPVRYVEKVDLNFLGSVIPAEEMVVIEGSDAFVSLSLRMFDGFIIQVDFSESKLCFYPRDAVDLREFENVDVDSDPETGNPVVRIGINEDVTTWVVLSFGYRGGVLVDGSIASLLDLYSEEDELQESDENLFSSTINSLEFGPYNLENVPIEFPKPGVRDNIETEQPIRTGTRISRNRGSNGRIGVDVLKNFTLTFDLERERMHIIAK